jgi:hypothetical protein
MQKLTNTHEKILERSTIAIRAQSPPNGAVQPTVERVVSGRSIRARLAKAEHKINSLQKMQRHTVTLDSLTVPRTKETAAAAAAAAADHGGRTTAEMPPPTGRALERRKSSGPASDGSAEK